VPFLLEEFLGRCRTSGAPTEHSPAAKRKSSSQYSRPVERKNCNRETTARDHAAGLLGQSVPGGIDLRQGGWIDVDRWHVLNDLSSSSVKAFVQSVAAIEIRSAIRSSRWLCSGDAERVATDRRKAAVARHTRNLSPDNESKRHGMRRWTCSCRGNGVEEPRLAGTCGRLHWRRQPQFRLPFHFNLTFDHALQVMRAWVFPASSSRSIIL